MCHELVSLTRSVYLWVAQITFGSVLSEVYSGQR